ncbi:unnamed protein product [Acanthoscelides obtectus]|uniref:Uncharacterized protein n=1 Tax=Acanthoscelides obtectus TaxID=200917 RepID=A0A9P0PR44_ACAOB|nr:unnamed protein product [Acanthoscelides obtectus]CAK1655723.1 Histone-lysine N-methyltransferase SETMAR [Acanthoscelides obtectus]
MMPLVIEQHRNGSKKFPSGDLSLSDGPRSGRPKIMNNEDLRQVVDANSRTTCQELAEMFRVSPETIRLHLHQLGKTWKLSKWVTHELTNDNKLSRLTFSKHFTQR